MLLLKKYFIVDQKTTWLPNLVVFFGLELGSRYKSEFIITKHKKQKPRFFFKSLYIHIIKHLRY